MDLVDKYRTVRPYLTELLGPQGVHSTSHHTLRRLYKQHGQKLVDQLLADYWEENGSNGQRDPLSPTFKGVA